MQKLIASVHFDKSIVYADWEALFNTKVMQISEEHKTSIHYEVRLNEIDSKIELRILNTGLQEWYYDITERKTIVDELIKCLSILIGKGAEEMAQ